jgi:hypothetical protein
MADYILVLGQEGRLVEQGTPTELLNSGTALNIQELVNSTKKSKRDVDPERNRPESVLTSRHSILSGASTGPKRRRLGDFGIYKLYIRTIGRVSWWFFVVLCTGFVAGLTLSREIPQCCYVSIHILTGSEEIWLRFWTEANARKPHGRLGYYLSLYSVWSALAIVFFAGACLYVLRTQNLWLRRGISPYWQTAYAENGSQSSQSLSRVAT